MWRNAWGKILGAFFGFSLAGPVGAIIGILIGNFFDKGLNIAQNPWTFAGRGQTRKMFNHVTFAVMGHIAKADGRVSEKEINVAQQLMQTMSLSESEKKEAIESFSQGKLATFKLDLALTELRFACRQQPSLLKIFVEIQYNAIVSTHSKLDLKIDIRKQRLLNTVFERLGFIPIFRTHTSSQGWQHNQRSSYQQYQNQHSYSNYRASTQEDAIESAYKILEVSSSATAAEIKKAYRKKMSVHHPDKLMAKGLSEKEIKQGTEKAQKIQAAYEKIKQFRGF